jgi:uncharacterized protein (UPF0332 family)
MKSEEIELVRHRLARATESLQEADLLMGHGHLRDMRQKSDYADLFKVGPDEVRALLHEATGFVDTISRIIDDMIPKPS